MKRGSENLNKVNKRCYCFWTISSSSFASSFILLVRELKNLIHKRIPRVLLQWLQTYLNKNSLFFIRPHVRYIEEISLLLKPLNNRIEGVHAEDPGEKKSSGFQKGRNPIISYNDNFRARRNGEKFASCSFRGGRRNIFRKCARTNCGPSRAEL